MRFTGDKEAGAPYDVCFPRIFFPKILKKFAKALDKFPTIYYNKKKSTMTGNQ